VTLVIIERNRYWIKRGPISPFIEIIRRVSRAINRGRGEARTGAIIRISRFPLDCDVTRRDETPTRDIFILAEGIIPASSFRVHQRNELRDGRRDVRRNDSLRAGNERRSSGISVFPLEGGKEIEGVGGGGRGSTKSSQASGVFGPSKSATPDPPRLRRDSSRARARW